MFYITDSEYGHNYIADTFGTLEDAYAAIDDMEAAIDDGAPSYRLRCAIAELKEQIDEHFASLDDTNWPIH